MQGPNSILWYSLLLIVLAICVISVLEKRRPSWQFYLRKSLHIVVIFVAAVASMLLDSVWLPILSWLASILLWIVIRRGWFEEVVVGEQTRKPWGMVYFSVIYALLTSLPWVLDGLNPNQLLMLRWMNGWSFCTLAFADGLAGIVGRWGASVLALDNERSNGIFKLESERKSWLGFVVFWFVAVAVGVLFLGIGDEVFPNHSRWVGSVVIPQLVVLGFVVAMVELVSGKGSDNLLVVLVVWLFAGVMAMGMMGKPQAIFHSGTEYLFVYMVLSVVAAILLYKKGILDNTGAAMAWILAFVVVVMAGWSLWPLIIFLGLASLVGRWRKKGARFIAGDLKEGKPRDRWQVLANGGLYLVCAVIVYAAEMNIAELFGVTLSDGFGEKCRLLALISISASSADTLSSEVGQWLGGAPRSIITGKKMPKGVSGGVTMAGFFGAILGAVAVGLCVCIDDWEVLGNLMGWCKMEIFIAVAGFGVIGTLIDSILGDLLQAKYRSVDGELLDRPDGGGVNYPEKGFALISNDIVNFLTGLLVLLVAWAVFS